MEIEPDGFLSTPFSVFELKQIHSEARDETEICNRLYIEVLIVLSPWYLRPFREKRCN
jgi:hypothetical protein